MIPHIKFLCIVIVHPNEAPGVGSYRYCGASKLLNAHRLGGNPFSSTGSFALTAYWDI